MKALSGDELGERILRARLRELPFHRAIIRSIEARILADVGALDGASSESVLSESSGDATTPPPRPAA